MKDNVEGEMLTQAAPISSINEEARTATVVFSTGMRVAHPVVHQGQLRMMNTRVVLEEGAARLDFLNESGPLLDHHMSFEGRNIIGRVQNARIEDGKALADVSFSTASDVEPLWQRVKDGSLRNVSMGFVVHDQELIEEQDEDGSTVEVLLFKDWEPLELSMVAVPADRGSRIQSQRVDKEVQMAENAQTVTGAEENGQPDTHEVKQGEKSPEMKEQAMTVKEQAPSAEDVRAAERTRISEIRQAATALKIADDKAEAAIEQGTEADEFRRQAIGEFAKAGQNETKDVARQSARVVHDAEDKFRQGAVEGIMARAGVEGGERNEFSGLTLTELARQSLNVSGQAIPSDRIQMVGAAFRQSAGSHSTSDFPSILADVAHKSALQGWEEAEETWSMWTRTGSATDFKPQNRVGSGLFASLPEIPEGAEYTYGSVAERKEAITVADYGQILRITRQAVINDDLDMLSRIPRKMGRAARSTIGDLVYAVLTANPNMSDGTALFHADHSNLASSGAVPSVATLTAARTAMMTQKEKAGGRSLNIRPRFIIVPAALETTVSQLLNSTVEVGASKGHASNPVQNMAELISDARLDDASATAWYLAADPNSFDTVEVLFLDGVQQPFLEEREGWTVDSVEWKVRITAGVGPLDYRTMYKNAGA